MRMDLDEVDLALIEQLRRDGRASFESLGHAVGLSRTTARARVQRLLDAGTLRVVANVHPEIDGIHTCASISVDVLGVPARTVAASISSMPEATFVSLVAGRHAIAVELRASSITALESAFSTIRAISGVRLVDASLYTDFVKEPYIPPQGPGNLEQYDAVDRQLLDLLRLDGRMPYADLADRVGLSPAATRTRVLRLLEAGAVSISGMVNPTTFGMTQMCGFQVWLTGQGDGPLAEIARMRSVDFLARTLGVGDAVGTLLTRTRAETIDALDAIRSLSGVGDVESWAHLELVKEDYDVRPIHDLPSRIAPLRVGR
jgi:DNA-binding Lrp family transcriptional regulator